MGSSLRHLVLLLLRRAATGGDQEQEVEEGGKEREEDAGKNEEKERGQASQVVEQAELLREAEVEDGDGERQPGGEQDGQAIWQA